MRNIKIRDPDISMMEARVRGIGGHGRLPRFDAAGLLRCGIDERPPASRWGDPVAPTHLAFFAVRGKTTCLTSRPPICFAAGERLVTPAGCERWFLTGRAPVTLLWFHFHPGGEWDFLSQGDAAARPAAHIPMLHAALEALLREQVEPDASARDTCDHLAALIVHYLRRDLLPPPAFGREEHRGLAELWHFLNGALARPWSVADMAARVHMSEGHFSRTVRRLHGVSPMDMLVRMRMESAALMLRTTSLPLEEVAREVGYGSAHAFSDAFLRHAGQRPGRFRRDSG